MRINHNIAALNTYRQLNSASTAQSKSMEKLSSGLRINRAGDDAAGLAISEKMRGQIRGLDMASKNAQDGISLIQTAEGALNETHDILQRMRELSVQSSNDTSTDADRKEIQKEVAQLKEEINRISSTTEFNTKKLLNGDLAGGKVAQGTKLESAELSVGGTVLGSNATGYDAFTIDSTNNSIVLKGASNTNRTITIESGTWSESELATKINDALAASQSSDGALDSADLSKVTASFNASHELVLTPATPGAALTVTSAGTASSLLNIPTAGLAVTNTTTAVTNTGKAAVGNALTITEGSNDKLQITLGDGTAQTIDLTATTNEYSKQEVVDMINDAIEANTELKGKVSASLDNTGKFVLAAKGEELTVTNTALSDDLGLTSAAAVTANSSTTLLTNLQDSEGNDFGLQVGDQIKINGKISGSAITEQTLTIAADTDISDLTAQIETAFGLDAGSVSLNSDGEVVVAGKDGTANAISDLKLSVDNRALFNNKLSSFRETQEAQDTKTDSSLSFQIGSNEGQTMKVDINAMSVQSLALSSVDVSTQQGAQTSISVINSAIEEVSTERSKLGAFQNRLEHTINNLGTSSENLTAAESRVRDVDMAKEMMTQTKNSILSQAAQAMLAQSNQMPQGVLQLLR